MQSYETEEADVLVIGAGAAGLWAAIRAKDFAKKVLLIEKGSVGRSGVSVFCHVYMSPLHGETADKAVQDMVERSTYMADQPWIKVLVEDNNARIADMEAWGVIFEKEGGALRTEKGSRGWRVKCRALANGQQLTGVLRAVALNKGVEFRERTMITDLLTSDGEHPTRGQVTGAVGFDTRKGTWRVFKSKAVIVSTGLIDAKLHMGYADNVTGDGLAMAFRAGAELSSMEASPSNSFSLYNKKIYSGGQAQFQIHGARLVNRLGEEFLHRYKGAARDFIGFDLQPDFGDLCRAIAIESLDGRGPVYFDLRAWGQEKIERMRRVLPFTMGAFEESGIDVTRDLVETTPVAATYCASNQAGLKTTTAAETTIAGLYAAGAASCVGRGVISQSFCFVSGYRAGESAGRQAQSTDFSALDSTQMETLKAGVFAPLHRPKGFEPRHIYYQANKTVTPVDAGLFKEESRIAATLDRIRRIARESLPAARADDIHELVKANEARNYLQLLELVFLSALERKESRLEHYREDYPYRDDRNWLKWILCKNGGQGHIEMKTVPVPLPYYSPPDRAVVPSPIQYKIARGGQN